MDTQSRVITADGNDVADMIDALRRSGAAFVGLLRDLDNTDGERPVPNLDWTASETAVHMLTVLRRGYGDRRRSDSIAGLADLNALTVSEVEERRPAALADTIEEFLARYLEGLAAVDPDRIVKLHAGVRTDVLTGLSYLLCDLLVHGFDIAQATGRNWKIDPALARLDVRALLPAIGPWVLPEVIAGPSQDVAVAFPGADWGLVARVGEDDYTVELVSPDRAEAVVDPVETLLTVAGRQSSDDPTVSRLASWFRPL